ncbi:MAG: carbamoyltransferase [Elusimicrobia bacterium]|nr:carbamoyltransferase [Elusimicrobiota bacterium]
MIILGINEDHNGTAALIKDGEVIACASEERFSRIKNDTEYPKQAIDSILISTGIKPAQIDYVAFAGKYIDPLQMSIKRLTRYKIGDYINEMHEYWHKILIDKTQSSYYHDLLKEKRFSDKSGIYYDYSFMKDTPEDKWGECMNTMRCKMVKEHLGAAAEKVSFVDHHTGHAYYAYYASPRDNKGKVAIVTADGWGDGCNATISVIENNSIKEIHRTAMCNMARMYRWTTLLLGMKPNEHEYKVMGLAPYTKDYLRKPAYEVYKETLVVDGLDFKWNKKPSDMYFYFREKFEGMRFDGISAGIQLWLEEILITWISNVMRHTGAEVLYYSGGLSMNVKANKVLAELPIIKGFYVSPSGGDESLAIGAAFVLAKEKGEQPKTLKHAYLGYAPTVEESIAVVAPFRNDKRFLVIDNPSNEMLAGFLAESKVLGRCVGNMEFGARSLGNRAILCDPSKHDNLRLINEKIKFRDFWMPFTPSILKERSSDYLVNPKNLNAEYMTIAFESTLKARKDLQAAIHPYDFTVRPQLVSKETNKEYYELLKAFEAISGIGGVLNTSLNLHGFPIVRTAQDAIETFINSGLDGMILPKILILKK